MFRVDVDLSGVEAITERARQELMGRSIARLMDLPLLIAAQRERSTHAYRNRTTRLEQSTVAVPDLISESEVRLSLQMTMPYAEFVWRKGLSDLDHYGALADVQIKQAFTDQVRRIQG
jgi:hypothetical protein